MLKLDEFTPEELANAIQTFYDETDREWPESTMDSLAFAQTEVSEAMEVVLARNPLYVRNHPEDKPEGTEWELALECGQAIMMLMVTCLMEGMNPLYSMLAYLADKIGEASDGAFEAS